MALLRVNQGDHHLPVVGLVTFVHDDEVAITDLLVDHRGAADLKHVAAPAARDQLVRDRDRVVADDGLDRFARRHEAEQRQLGGPGLALGGTISIARLSL